MRTVCALALCVVAMLPAQQSAPGDAAVDYARDVAPIFRKNCYGCHGPAMQTSGFRLDDPVAALKGGYGGASILPGNSAESKLIQRVSAANGMPVMPPAGKRLNAEEVGLLRRWIDEGARVPEHPAIERSERAEPSAPRTGHWSFQPIGKPDVPKVANAEWVKNPIDAFVLARLEREKIEPSPEAARATLLRRLSFDLIGLPPTPAELAAFVEDLQPGAYQRQVERLLASPHFGEKWARSWLDQARYADSDGYEKDWFRPWAWRWRNWVIDAINRDMPFDQFTVEQIAGDLLPNATVEQRVATGFHRNTLTNREGGVDSVQFEFEGAVDRASTVGTVWLGLSVGCAQCHDHKFDPISQKDFYSLFAYFDGLEEVEIDAPLAGEMGPWLRSNFEYKQKREAMLVEYKIEALQAAWEKDILYTIAHPGERTDWDLAWDCVLKLTEGGDGAKIVQIPPMERTPRERDVLTDHFIGNAHFAYGGKQTKAWKLDELGKKLLALKNEYPQLSQAQAVAERSPARQHFLRVRGDYKTNGIEVQAATLSVLPQPTGGDRLNLARWLVARENPLTARVAVNRIWQEIFGTGIVGTSDDFGSRSEAPSHPELLDWLAATFREEGWSRKQILRLIVNSATYLQSSDARPQLSEVDPGNRLLARQSRLRLSAELIRDNALAASGLLSRTVGGPSVRPPIPNGVMELSYASRYAGFGWKESDGADRYRRGLYVQFLRTTPYPQLVNFDAPKAVLAVCKRERSNSPLQALNLLNDPVFMEAAQALAAQALLHAKPNFEARVQWAFAHALGRSARTAELTRMQAYFEQQQRLLAQDEEAIAALAPLPAPGLSRLETAAFTGVASVLLNLDEFITRE
ncbi:MAG: PSD1 and planctomycete cytochrome C domain-containing protein [Bryobacterales bacterium]|nr:PSD1 and planctomycete cytochrome C domain-containing protein [Bryobacterales bacterium]